MINLISELYKDNRPGRNILLYSGGCDSTFLLNEIINACPNQIIYTAAIDAPWLDKNKYASEYEAREKAIHHFLEKGALIRHQEIQVSHVTIPEMLPLMKTREDCLQAEPGGAPQAVYWLSTIAIYLRPGDHLYYGLLGGDSNVQWNNHYEEAMRLWFTTLCRDTAELRTPLIIKNKDYVLTRLLEDGLYDYAWYCETPPEKGVPCHKCQPCTTHLKTLAGIAEFHENEDIRKKARTVLDDAHKSICESDRTV